MTAVGGFRGARRDAWKKNFRGSDGFGRGGRVPVVMKHILIALLLAASLPAAASSDPAGDGKAAETPPATFSVDFLDCPLGDAVAFLRARTGINVVMDRNLEGLLVPNLKMEKTTAEGFLRTLGHLMPEIEFTPLAPPAPGEQPMIAITAARQAPEPSVCRVFRMPGPGGQEAEERLEFEKMLGAAHLALEVAGEANGRSARPEVPQIERHPQSGLVVVAGRAGAVGIVAQVIVALGGAAAEPPAPPAPPAAGLGEIKDLIKGLAGGPAVISANLVIKHRAPGEEEEMVVSAPRVITLSGQPATISFGYDGADDRPGGQFTIELDIRTLTREDAIAPAPDENPQP
jgi:hypothetical protein